MIPLMHAPPLMPDPPGLMALTIGARPLALTHVGVASDSHDGGAGLWLSRLAPASWLMVPPARLPSGLWLWHAAAGL